MGKNHAVIHKRLAAINVDAVSPFRFRLVLLSECNWAVAHT